MFRRAFPAEQLALRWLQHALQYFPALRGLGIGDSSAGDREALLGIPLGVFVADLQGRLGDESETAPFEVGPELKDFGHRLQRGPIALPRYNSFVLILDSRLSRLELPKQHNDGLQKVEWFES